jgi:alcohol dehydrogenase class IV
VKPFEYLTPTRIVFGAGSLDRAGECARELGGQALIVCGRGAMRSSGVLDRLTALLRERGLAVSVFDGVSPDPKASEVDAALALARQRSCDLLVGLGGGSALDAAKAASVAFDRDSVAELVGKTLPRSPRALPVLAIPTTAGSGAEVTRGAIVTDTERGLKSGIRGDDVFPRIALVDPELTATVPPPVAAETGFDALTHAVETYVARKASPLSEALSEDAARRLGEALPRLAAGRPDAATRAQLSYAALLGGLTVATASTCLPHRLQQAMGSVPRLPVSHGRGLAAVYPAWIERAYPYAPARFDRLGALLGAEGFASAIERLLAELELDDDLGRLGFGEADIEACMGGISGNVDNDPIDGIEPALLREIYEDSRRSPSPTNRLRPEELRS